MSAIRLTFLYCDGGEQCPREESTCVPLKIDPIPGEDAATQRAQAKADGWTKRGTLDYCPECSKRLLAPMQSSGDNCA